MFSLYAKTGASAKAYTSFDKTEYEVSAGEEVTLKLGFCATMGYVARETNRLTEMVVELLDFTRMQDGRMTLNVEPTDIRSEFEDTGEL